VAVFSGNAGADHRRGDVYAAGQEALTDEAVVSIDVSDLADCKPTAQRAKGSSAGAESGA
jgi:hypothetical protein